MVARVTCGWKCGKELGAVGSGCRDISFWRSADSGSEGTSQTAMPAAPSGGIVIMDHQGSSVVWGFHCARHTHRRLSINKLLGLGFGML